MPSIFLVYGGSCAEQTTLALITILTLRQWCAIRFAFRENFQNKLALINKAYAYVLSSLALVFVNTSSLWKEDLVSTEVIDVLQEDLK